MTIKKKLGLGVASAALGLSLVGGGTWAAFNDTATINNQFAAGTLNLDIGKDGEGAVNFDLRNMKPGDTAKRYFILENGGTLSIKDVLMELQASGFIDGMGEATDAKMMEYLAQFKVDFFRVRNPENNTTWDNPTNLIIGNVTLADLHNKAYQGKIVDGYVIDNRINLAPTGLPVGDKDGVGIQITLKETAGNEFQGDGVKIAFNLEARQEAGVEVKTNGYIKSNENHPSTPVSTDNSDGANLEEVTDNIDNPEEGGGKPVETPGEITVTDVRIIKNEWQLLNDNQGYKLSAEVEFTFSDGNTIKSNTVNRNNADPNGESITFTKKYKNKNYSTTQLFIKK